jgi:hypothetical protein
MTIHSLWGWRHGESAPELMEAWDDGSVDENYEGWNRACEKARESWGDDLLHWRIILIKVHDDAIVGAFAPAEVDAA